MQTKIKEIASCCARGNSSARQEKRGFWQGLLLGLAPHSFCILFILFSIAGATAGASLMKKFLILPYFFPILIALSLVFATLSASFYLRRNHLFFCRRPAQMALFFNSLRWHIISELIFFLLYLSRGRECSF